MKKLIFILILLSMLGLFADKPKLAVMNFTDETEGKLSKDLVKNGSKLIRSRFTRNAKEFFEVVTDKENEAALAAMKKESHRLDRDRNFQIELGKQVSAAKIVMSTIGNLDKKTFLITSTLTDVARGVDENSADAIFDGTAEGLLKAVDHIIIQLLGFEDESLVPKKSEGQIACEEARAAGSEQKWKAFLKYYADEYPDCVQEATKQLEEIAFHKAEREDTVEAWQKYLEEYPMANKRHAITAEERIEKLKKETQKAEERKKIAAEEKKAVEENITAEKVGDLYWSEKAPERMNLNAAKNYCRRLNEGGISGWRLPTIDELRTIIQNCPNSQSGGSCKVSEKYGCLSSSCLGSPCQCGSNSSGLYSFFGDSEIFWSSSFNSSERAFIVDFLRGGINNQYIGNNYNVRCVK